MSASYSMITDKEKREFYEALLARNREYEGVFFVGVTTTGVFCRPTCAARKPKFEHCEFFRSAKDAILASFRECKRCKPLSDPTNISDLVKVLIEAVENDLSRKWKSADLYELSLDTSTARRNFKKCFGMTFVEYARARRIGAAIKTIREGGSVINAQLDSGYESSSGFRDAFSKIIGAAPSRTNDSIKLLKASWIDTKLGSMLAIADEEELYLLEFVDRRGLEREIEKMKNKLRAAIVPGETDPIVSIKEELLEYLDGRLKNFKTPIHLIGTTFQKKVWNELMQIAYGDLRSYKEQAKNIGMPSACRAVANANGSNQLAIVVPCHRIIRDNGDLGGYGGGVARKKWLIEHEKANL